MKFTSKTLLKKYNRDIIYDLFAFHFNLYCGGFILFCGVCMRVCVYEWAL